MGNYNMSENKLKKDSDRYAPYLELKENKAGRWYYNVMGQNGQILSTSEAYARKTNAHRAASSFIATVEKYGIYLK